MPENPLVERILAPLAAWYRQPGVEEIAINQPGEVWIKPIRKNWEVHKAPDLTYEVLADRICYVLANAKRVPFRREMPIVACEIAGANADETYRFQALVGSNIRYNATDSKGVALCVRVLRSGREIGLEQFFASSADGTGKVLREGMGIAAGDNQRYSDDPMDDLCKAVAKGKSVLVSGPTSTGKALRNGTPVQTPQGLRGIETLKVGDPIFDHSGKVTQVAGVYPQGRLPLFRLHLEDGRKIEACAEHLWPAWFGPRPVHAAVAEASVVNTSGLYTALSKGHVWLSALPPAAASAWPDPDHAAAMLAQLNQLGDAAPSGLGDGSLVLEAPSVDSAVAAVQQARAWGLEARRVSAHFHEQATPSPGVLVRRAMPSPIRLVAIEPAGEDQATCISVASQAKLYVAGPGIVTHNTTFLNNLIKRMPLDMRICTFQDALELDIPHPNRVQIWAPRAMIAGTVGYGPLLDSIIRLTPDAIIAGEISIDNAQPIARLLTMGHASFMSTIHAGSCDEAVDAFVQNMALKTGGIDQKAMSDRLRKSLARRVQIDRFGGERSVTEIAIGDAH